MPTTADAAGDDEMDPSRPLGAATAAAAAPLRAVFIDF
eukprot:SAG22_NODE_2562_length_2439_cov_1.936752_1_plen_37_part_10